MKTKFKLLSIIALLASTMFIQACGPAIDFTPLTKEEVKKLDDAGDKWTKDARDLIVNFGFNHIDMKTFCIANLTKKMNDSNKKNNIDEHKKVLKALKDKKDSKEVVGLLGDKDDYVNNLIKVDEVHPDATPKGLYLASLKAIAIAGTTIAKTTLEDELARVEKKADVKLLEQEIKASGTILYNMYADIYNKLK